MLVARRRNDTPTACSSLDLETAIRRGTRRSTSRRRSDEVLVARLRNGNPIVPARRRLARRTVRFDRDELIPVETPREPKPELWGIVCPESGVSRERGGRARIRPQECTASHGPDNVVSIAIASCARAIRTAPHGVGRSPCAHDASSSPSITTEEHRRAMSFKIVAHGGLRVVILRFVD